MGKLFQCFGLFILFIALWSDHAKGQFSPGKVFLLGGATQDDNAELYQALKNATGKESPRIVVAISAAGSLEVGLQAYYDHDPSSWSYEYLFNFYGFLPDVLHLARDNWEEGASNSTNLGSQNIRLVEQADVIFFNGGDQSRHSRAWFNTDGSDSDIMRAVKERFAVGAVLAGTSAGAAIMGPLTYGDGASYGYYYFDADLKPCQIGETLADDREGESGYRYNENGGYMQGFNFVRDVVVDTHFDARGRIGRLPAAMKSTSTPFGIGVGENTALYINQDMATCIGEDAVWFVDSSEAVYNDAAPQFEVSDLKVSYLSNWDTLNLTSKEVASTKQVITSGEGLAYRSNDIFDTMEGMKTMTSLAESAGSQGEGRSKERNPRTLVTFHKGRGEMAYTDGEKFTIDKMYMGFGTV